MRATPAGRSKSSTQARPTSRPGSATSPAAKVPTSSSTRWAIHISRRRKIACTCGRQILIAAVDKTVPFNILEFYRGRHTYVGIDTLAFSSVASADILREALPGLVSGHLKPYPIADNAIYSLTDARAAYLCRVAAPRAIASSSSRRREHGASP